MDKLGVLFVKAMKEEKYNESDWNDVFHCLVCAATHVVAHIKIGNTDTVGHDVSNLQSKFDKRRQPKRPKTTGL